MTIGAGFVRRARSAGKAMQTLIIIGLLIALALFALLAWRSERDRMAAEARAARLEQDLVAAQWALIYRGEG